jgi:hypothetical protein
MLGMSARRRHERAALRRAETAELPDSAKKALGMALGND